MPPFAGTSFIQEFYLPNNPGGLPVGIQINGYLFVTGQVLIPYTGALVVQASDGTYWQIGINVVDGEGVLTTTQLPV